MPEKPPKVPGRRRLRPKVYVCRRALAYPHGGREGTLHVGPCKCDPLFGNQLCNSIAPRLFKVTVQFFKMFIPTRRARGHTVKRLPLRLSTQLFPGCLLLNYSGASPAQPRLGCRYMLTHRAPSLSRAFELGHGEFLCLGKLGLL
jgi:hypothetical protein